MKEELIENQKSNDVVTKVGTIRTLSGLFPLIINYILIVIAILTGLHMNSAPPDEIETVYSFCESIGLPTTFEDIGLLNPSMEMLRIAAIKACAPEECIHHEMMKITPEMVLDAMIVVNAMGVQRKLKR
ncbi:MAG TPA: hypothetical protein P5338_12830 [Bacteroidales bacterium]|nr:hypothetical protein [Bacteroidales bacterium]